MALNPRKRRPSAPLQAPSHDREVTGDDSATHQNPSRTIRLNETTNHYKTGIMALPTELLIQIIGYTLTKPRPITLHRPHEYRWAKELNSLQLMYNKRFKRTRKSDLLKILLVCHEFYFAGLEAYYGGNVFHFDSPLDFRDTFIKTLSDRHKACIKHVVIDWEWYHSDVRSSTAARKYYPKQPFAVASDLLEDFHELQSATVNVWMRQEPVFLAAASKANIGKSQIREMVLAVWPSMASKLEFVFPKSWGRLADM